MIESRTIIPHLKEITQPGMSVVFLIQRPVDGFKWLQAYSAIMQCGLEKPLAVRKMVESHSAEMNRRLAQQRVFHACEALHELGGQNSRGNIYRQPEKGIKELRA